MPFSLKLIRYLSSVGNAENTCGASVLKWLQVLLEKKLTQESPNDSGREARAGIAGVFGLSSGRRTLERAGGRAVEDK